MVTFLMKKLFFGKKIVCNKVTFIVKCTFIFFFQKNAYVISPIPKKSRQHKNRIMENYWNFIFILCPPCPHGLLMPLFVKLTLKILWIFDSIPVKPSFLPTSTHAKNFKFFKNKSDIFRWIRHWSSSATFCVPF